MIEEILYQERDGIEAGIENEGDETNTSVKNNLIDEKYSSNSRNRIRHYGVIDIVILSICSFALIANHFIQNPIFKWSVTFLALISIVVPVAVKKVKDNNEFTLAKALKVLSDAGLKPRVVNGEIRWNSAGKENIVRVYEGGLLQLAREYPIGRKGAIDSNERAAISTMNEICSIKVGVRREGEDEGSLIFSAESLCPTEKLFKLVYAEYVQALDIAEERQGIHLQEVIGEKKAKKRRIGYDYSCE